MLAMKTGFIIPALLLLLSPAVSARETTPTPLPEGPGLAASYPADRDIGSDPLVVFAEDFEGSYDDLQLRWSTISGPETLSLVAETPQGSRGKQSLQITARRRQNNGGLVYKVLDQGYEKLHMRFYVKFSKDHPYLHHFVRIAGRINPPPWPISEAGNKPEKSFSAGLDVSPHNGNTYPSRQFAPPGNWTFYHYWPEMRSWQTPWGAAIPGQPNPYYGNGFYPHPPVVVPRDEWICVEIMVKLNSSPTAADGAVALWINGKLVSHFGPGTVTGYWEREAFRTDPTNARSRPFEGFRWRLDDQVLINSIKLESYVTETSYQQTEQYNAEHPEDQVNIEQGVVWFDHLVVATEYIGPLWP